MLRRGLLWASTNPFLAERLPRLPFVRRAVRRFMPGESTEDALDAAARREREGAGAVLTLLGENVEDEAEARAVVDHYRGVLERARERGLDVEISVKPTHLGLDLSPDLAAQNLRELTAAAEGSFVWVDMESSPYVDATLELYRAARREHDHVGVCLQAYLHRTPTDLQALLPLEPAIRLVKGAYLEPPDVAHPKKRSVDAAFKSLARTLLLERRAGRMGRPALATHDGNIQGDVTRMARELAAAESGAVYARLGTTAQEFGTLASWLVDVLNALT
ncbi:MAG: proline dehydrogenase family protein, partial [Gemmatimonadetes bacterium]|nr:proline dehydrogenase family protein [Gemmatimonadota bacterium]